MITEHEPWMELAACRSVMADWVPERRSSESDYLALRFCQGCPVRSLCEALAVRKGYTGVWGGKFFTKAGRAIDLLREAA